MPDYSDTATAHLPANLEGPDISGQLPAAARSENAYQHIRTLLLEGDLGPDDKLSVVDLTRELACSRVPVMEALKRLEGEGFIEEVTGRYLHLNIEGRHHRIYFEEAGQGVPLICLHTAGADGRQYRSILNDADVTRNFRVVVFDLPGHGKSSPPAGFEQENYELTTDRYVATVMAVKRALQLDNPVVMGCSIGGRVVVHLAARHADELRLPAKAAGSHKI